MAQIQSTSKEQQLKQIAEMLLLYGTLTECPGLAHGKMGISIFFFHYARYTGNIIFEEYAFDLIEKIQEQIHVNSPASYEKGIAGIGVGIDYLIRNKFLDAEDDIFEDFDQKMVCAVMYDPCQDFSLYEGLTGYGKYWMARLRQLTSSVQAKDCLLRIIGRIEEKLPDIPVSEQTDVYCFLHDLQEISVFDAGRNHALPLLKQCRRAWDLQSSDVIRSFSRLGDSAVGRIVRAYLRILYFNDGLQDEIDFSLTQIPEMDIEKLTSGMGLLTGFVGEGLLRLTALDQANTSWMQLL